MTDNIHVRELLRFEEQRLGTSITWCGQPHQQEEPAGVILRRPDPSLLMTTSEVTLPGGDGRTILSWDAPEVPGTRHSASGLPVAISNGRNVHLLIDVHALASDRPLLGALWDGVASALTAAAEDAVQQAEREQLDAFVSAEEHVWRGALRRLPGEIENLEYAVSRLESQMREQCTRLFDLRCRHRAMQVALPEAVRQAAREQHAAFRRLVPNTYRSIEIKDGVLVGVLGPVVIEHDDDEIEVGTFEVRIDLANGEISIHNTTRVVNGIHHPHVRSPQDICWGNIRSAVLRNASEREWTGVLVAVYRFLGSYAEGDAYQPLSAWDPNHSEDDEEYDDESDEESEVETCTMCLEETDSSEITWVRDEAVCLECIERGDVFRCARCHGQFTSREQARESTQCTGCWEAQHFTCPSCSQVRPLSERAESGACSACVASGGWRIPAAAAVQEVAS